MKLSRSILTKVGVIIESEEALKEAGEGSEDTSKIINATGEEKNEDGLIAQDEVSINPEDDDRKKEIKDHQKTQEKEQEKMVDGELQESFTDRVLGKIDNLLEEALSNKNI